MNKKQKNIKKIIFTVCIAVGLLLLSFVCSFIAPCITETNAPDTSTITEYRLEAKNYTLVSKIVYTDEQLVQYNAYVDKVIDTICFGDKNMKALELFMWVCTHISPKEDIDIYGVEEYWASPFETLYFECGDCEDFTILLMFLFKKIGVNALSLIYKLPTNVYHSVVLADVDIPGQKYDYLGKTYTVFDATTHTLYARGDIHCGDSVTGYSFSNCFMPYKGGL